MFCVLVSYVDLILSNNTTWSTQSSFNYAGACGSAVPKSYSIHKSDTQGLYVDNSPNRILRIPYTGSNGSSYIVNFIEGGGTENPILDPNGDPQGCGIMDGEW